jgi:hypothetical protein
MILKIFQHAVVPLCIAAVVQVSTLADQCYGWQGSQTNSPKSFVGSYLLQPTQRLHVGRSSLAVKANADGENIDAVKNIKPVEKYKNAATAFLSNFIQKDNANGVRTTPASKIDNPLAMIDWDAPKISSSTSIEKLAAALDYELTEKEWFVTGQANPSYFSDDFEFQDPDVQLSGIREYCEGVNRLFNQQTSRAEIISTVVNTTASSAIGRPVITCTWRLSGGVDVGPGITIKPYIIYTDFIVDPDTRLITNQEDRFSIPSWDILLR